MPRICSHGGCLVRANYGVAGTKKRDEFCAGHAIEGMINLTRQINVPVCAHPGCTTQPSFGVAGTRKSSSAPDTPRRG